MKKLLLLLAAVTVTSCATVHPGYKTCHTAFFEIGETYDVACIRANKLYPVEQSAKRRVFRRGDLFYYFSFDYKLYKIDKGVPRNTGGNVTVNQYN